MRSQIVMRALACGGILSFAGCQSSNRVPAATQPSVQIDPRADYPLAAGLERDLTSLKDSRAEGLLTENEYQRSRWLVISQVSTSFLTSRAVISPPQQSEPERLHAELAGLDQMRKGGIMTQAEYEYVRQSFVAAFVPADAPTGPATQP
jgi:hypothetical protein